MSDEDLVTREGELEFASEDDEPAQKQARVDCDEDEDNPFVEIEGADDESDWFSEDEEQDDETDPIDERLAAFMQKRLSLGMSTDRRKEKLGKYKVPSNIKAAKVVRMNREIFASMLSHARKYDGTLRYWSSLSAKSALAIAQALEKLLRWRKGNEKERQVAAELNGPLMDALAFACHQAWDINSKRVG